MKHRRRKPLEVLRIEIIVQLNKHETYTHWGVTFEDELEARKAKIESRGHKVGRVLTQQVYKELLIRETQALLAKPVGFFN